MIKRRKQKGINELHLTKKNLLNKYRLKEMKKTGEQSDFVQALFTTLKQAPSTSLQRVGMSLVVSIQFLDIFSEPFRTLNQ